MTKTAGRKSILRKLAEKNGWRDGYAGLEAAPPTRCVMVLYAKCTEQRSVPMDEEKAYWHGYNNGQSERYLRLQKGECDEANKR